MDIATPPKKGGRPLSDVSRAVIGAVAKEALTSDRVAAQLQLARKHAIKLLSEMRAAGHVEVAGRIGNRHVYRAAATVVILTLDDDR